jgi:hypothetical protein
VARSKKLLIAAGLLALLTACESLPDEKALAVNDPAFSPLRLPAKRMIAAAKTPQQTTQIEQPGIAAGCWKRR